MPCADLAGKNTAMSKQAIQGSPAPQDGEAVSGNELDLTRMFLEQGEVTEDEKNQDEAEADSETVLSQDQTDEDSADEAGDDQDETEANDGETEGESEDEESNDETEGDESDDEGEEGEGENLADLEYPKFKKRVDKLTRQKKELQSQLDALNARMKQLESGQGDQAQAQPKQSGDPFASLSTMEEVQEKANEAQAVWDWGLKLLEGTEDTFVIDDGNGGEEELSREDVRNITQRAQHTLQTVLPKRAQHIQQRAQFDQVAVEHYPWLNDQESAEYQETQQMLKVFPELAQFPDINLSLGDLVEGRKARVAKAKAKGKKPAAPKTPKIAPPQPGRSSSPAPIDKGKAKKKGAMEAVFASGGQQKDLESYFKS